MLSISAFPHCAAPQIELVKTAGPLEFATAPHDPNQIELGERPFALLDLLSPGLLRSELEACRDTPVTKRRFSIGHRGAPRGYPEHTREGYLAAAAMGAGTKRPWQKLVVKHSRPRLSIPQQGSSFAQPKQNVARAKSRVLNSSNSKVESMSSIDARSS